jgi:hypothetical protein
MNSQALERFGEKLHIKIIANGVLTPLSNANKCLLRIASCERTCRKMRQVTSGTDEVTGLLILLRIHGYWSSKKIR